MTSMTADRSRDPLVADVFLDRWSPRTFSTEPLSDETIDALFRAARLAPSSFNEQPWKFVWATNGPAREDLNGLLVDANRQWATSAPLLIIVFARKNFTRNGRPNRWAPFDAGSAWMSLALQATILGLHTHAMGGFDEERSYEVTGLDPAEYTAMAAIAAGYLGVSDAAKSVTRIASTRKDLSEVAVNMSSLKGGTR